MRPHKTLLMLLATIGLTAAFAGPAQARTGPEVAMQDDRMMMFNFPDETAVAMRRLGVKRIRLNALWASLLPNARGPRKPAGFEGWRHNDPRYDWGRLDRSIQAASNAGLRIHLTVTGAGPVWASANPRRGLGQWRPSPLEFGRFAQAVATRYGSLVDMYSIWNEPNHPEFLQPQSWGRIAYAPHHYRHLVRASFPRMKRADRTSRILIGETQPSGHVRRGAKRPLKPQLFWREFGCRDRRFRPDRRGLCRGFRTGGGEGIAHHPHLIKRSPRRRMRHRDDISLNEQRQFQRTIDRLQRLRAIRKVGGGRFSFWFTEFGYQTNPPDPRSGVSLRRQSEWAQDVQYRMWLYPRVRGWTHYILRDAPPETDFRQWDSGFFFYTGRSKPIVHTWQTPFVLSRQSIRRGQRIRIWGQFKAPTSGRRQIRIEYRRPGSGRWRTLRRMQTDSRGYFSYLRRLPVSLYLRFQDEASGQTSDTRGLRVRRR